MSKPVQPNTRSALLCEAERLIRSRGYAGFSYADLSTSVGITKASIHHHFPTKEKLVTSALEVYHERYAAAFHQIEAEQPNALDRIAAYGRMYLSGLDQGVGCLCAALAVERDTLPESLHAMTAAFFSAHLIWLESIYRDGLSKGQVSCHLDAASAAQLALSALQGALLVERTLDKSEGFETVLRLLLSAFSPIGGGSLSPG